MGERKKKQVFASKHELRAWTMATCMLSSAVDHRRLDFSYRLKSEKDIQIKNIVYLISACCSGNPAIEVRNKGRVLFLQAVQKGISLAFTPRIKPLSPQS